MSTIGPQRNIITPRAVMLTAVLSSVVLVILIAFEAAPRAAVRPPPPPSSQTPGQTPAPAQTPPAQEPVVRISTELVQIDIVVTNREGKLVGDLKREDFQLLEDGVPQQLSHFAVGTSTRPATWLTAERPRRNPSEATLVQPVEVPNRYVVLAVDDIHIAPENLAYAKQMLQRFLREQMTSGDQVAVATTTGALGLLQQFTNERPVIERAINRLTSQQRSATTAFDIPRITDYQAELIDIGDQDATELAVQEILRNENPQQAGPPRGGRSQPGQINEGGMSPRERAASQARSRARMIVNENAHFTQATLSTLENLIRSLRDLPGRKLMVLLSDGFFMGGSSGNKSLDIRRVTDAATRAGVVIYAMDTRGLYATNPAGDASQPSGFEQALPGARSRIESSGLEARRNGLNALARDTGGFPVFDTNDFSVGLKRILADNETYYVLAWEPEQSYRDGRFRKIEVKLLGHPELKVRTRKGYFAPDERAKAKEVEKAKEIERKGEKAILAAKQEQIRGGLAALFPLRAVPVELAADFIDTTESGAVALVTVQIEAATLNFASANGMQKTALDVVTVIFDEKGKTVTNFSDRLNLNLQPQIHEQVIRRGLLYRKMVPLKPGFYQVRLAVREEGSGQLGSASRWVEITDVAQKKLTLSSILITGTDPLSETPGSKDDPKIGGYEPRPTQAQRRFAQGGSIDFLLFAYNARLAEGQADLVVQSQIFSGSKLIYSTPLTRITSEGAPDLQRLPYAARLSLNAFDPGEYELRLLVIDRLAKATADRRVNFTITK
jgi:VWFA-related protein